MSQSTSESRIAEIRRMAEDGHPLANYDTIRDLLAHIDRDAMTIGLLKSNLADADQNFTNLVKECDAQQAQIEKARKSLALVIVELESFEDGAPDAPYISKVANYLLIHARATQTALRGSAPSQPETPTNQEKKL